MVNRDYYQLLGVPLGASADEIRSAYRKRISVIHPDRFDPALQPEQWQAANEMLMELNSAYDVLHHPYKRALYDESLAAMQPKKLANRAVRCRFKDLPPATQERLLVLQKGRSQFFKFQSRSPVNVFRFKTGNPALAWCGLLIAALVLGGVIQFEFTGNWPAHLSLLIWGGGLPGMMVLSIAVYKLVRWYRSPIKDYVYLTPLYYIKTSPGHVTFRWLWSSETLVVKPMTNRLRQRQGGMLLLAFDDKPQKLRLASEEFAREVAYALSIWEKLIVDLNGKRDGALLDQLDAFPEISARLGKRPAPDPHSADAGKEARMDDGSARRGPAALEQKWFYVKGW
ncbi:MAG: molecular chaperone DnaJ [Blastocatellia bacterium]